MWHYFNVLLEVHIKEVWLYNIFIGEFDIFPLMSFSDIVSMNGLPLVLENIWVWRHIMTFNTVKYHNVIFKVSTYITTSITVCYVRLAVLLAIMSVSSVKAAVILNIQY